jgi:hypothetical protein
MLVFLMVIGVLLVAAGTATLVGADSWTDQIGDINIDTGVFMGVVDGGVAPGVILLAASIITNLRPTDFLGLEIWLTD